jgi:hypothetical protein
MLGMMYTINRDASGVTLTCNECEYTVRVSEFDDKLGSPEHRPPAPCCARLVFSELQPNLGRLHRKVDTPQVGFKFVREVNAPKIVLRFHRFDSGS